MKPKIPIGMNHIMISLFMVFVFAHPASAQNASGTVRSVDVFPPSLTAGSAVDTQPSGMDIPRTPVIASGLPAYQLGILAFEETGNISGKETPILGPMLARLLRERMKILPAHPAGTSEVPAVHPLKKSVFIKSRELGTLLDDEARIMLDPELDRDQRNSELRNARAKILEARKALEKAKADAQRHEVSEQNARLKTKPVPDSVQFSEASGEEKPPSVMATSHWLSIVLGKNRRKAVWKSSVDGSLLQNPQGMTTAVLAEKENLDAIIHGTVLRQNREFILEIRYYERKTGTSTLIHTSRGLVSRPLDVLDECIPMIESRIAAGDCARIELVSNLENVRFYQESDTELPAKPGIDSENPGIDPVFYVYQPVKMSIIAVAPGEQAMRREVQITPDEPVSRYRETFAFPVRVIPDASAVMKPGIDPDLKAVLASGSKPDYATTFFESRNRFYKALGLFVVSLPVALLGSSIFQMYLDGYGRSNQQRMLNGSIISGIFFGTSVVAGAVFGIQAGISLAAYIGSAH